MITRFIFLAIFLSAGFNALTQNINTPTPTVPFGSNQGYQYGVLPSNLPTTGTYGTGQDAADAYMEWYSRYVRPCNDGTIKVRWDGESDAVSEGIAYGMIIAAYAGDKELLDGLWGFYKKNANNNGLMNWRVSGCENSSASGTGAATDAEVDAAMALIIAEYQWPDINTPYDYTAEATDLITNIKDHEVQSSSAPGPYQLLPGDSWGSTGNTCRNPSYIPIGYLKSYGEFVSSQSNFWLNQVVPANYDLLLNNIHPTTGLNSDWCSETGTPGGCGDGGKFGDDASRGPWRNAIDALWYGSTEMTTVCSNIAKYCASKGGPSSAPGDVNIDGSGTGNTNIIWRAMFGVGVMGADPGTSLQGYNSVQDLVNAYYTNVKNSNQLTDRGYFPEILRMISMMVMSGNFWKPGEEITGPPCSKANLGPDQTLCGVGSIKLEHGSGTTQNKTFQWYAGEVPLGTSSTLTVNEPNTYKIEIDSLGCIKTDEIVISGTIPQPDLGNDTVICSPSFITLNSNVSGNGVSYTWSLDNSDLLDENMSTLENVRIPGVYKVTASAIGCASVSDEVTVSSNNPLPVDACRPNPGSVTLSIDNAGAGPYQWYSSLTGGTSLHEGTSFTTNISSTSTYYVDDAGSISTIVGLPSSSSFTGVQSRGSSQSESDIYFNAITGFTLDYITVEIYTYNCNAPIPVTIAIYDGSNDLVGDNTYSVECTNSGLQRFRIPVGVTIPQGSNYKLTLEGSIDIGWYQDVISYPQTYQDILEVTASGASWAPNSTAGYYDWEISTGNNCARVPVIAEINPECVITGLENNSNQSIAIYPNPSSGNTPIKIKSQKGIGMIRILDSKGFLILEKNVTVNSIEIPEAIDLSQGVYFIEITQNGHRETYKYLKF